LEQLAAGAGGEAQRGVVGHALRIPFSSIPADQPSLTVGARLLSGR